MKRKSIIWSLAVILIAAGGLGIAYFLNSKTSKVKYRTAKAERGSISAYVTANGTVNPVITVLVGTQVSGTIQKLFADFNSQVKEGQPITQIDPAIFKAQLSQAKAKVENARASLLNAQADIATARANLETSKANVLKAKVAVDDTKRSLERSLQLFQRNLISASEQDSAQTSYDSAKAQLEAANAQQRASDAQLESAQARLESARAQVKQAEAEVELAQVNLDHTRIIAPVTGIVISRNVDVGQTVAASLQTPTLFTIAKDLTKMQVDTNVSEADIGRVAVGQEASFTVDAFPQNNFTGKVTEIRNAPMTIQNVVTYNVVIQVDNPQLKLKPGMTANVSILVAHKDNALKIPNAALRFRPDFAKKETAPLSKAPPSSSAASPSGSSAEQLLARLKSELKLTPEQEGNISRILKDAQTQIQAARRAGGGEEARAKAKELRATNRLKIRSLLTEEQKTMYDQMDQRSTPGQVSGPVFKVWTPVLQGQPVPVEVVTGISDGSFTEVVSGGLRAGQEVITETIGGNSKSSTRQPTGPSMRGFR